MCWAIVHMFCALCWSCIVYFVEFVLWQCVIMVMVGESVVSPLCNPVLLFVCAAVQITLGTTVQASKPGKF